MMTQYHRRTCAPDNVTDPERSKQPWFIESFWVSVNPNMLKLPCILKLPVSYSHFEVERRYPKYFSLIFLFLVYLTTLSLGQII
jgi:hypothetical protein